MQQLLSDDILFLKAIIENSWDFLSEWAMFIRLLLEKPRKQNWILKSSCDRPPIWYEVSLFSFPPYDLNSATSVFWDFIIFLDFRPFSSFVFFQVRNLRSICKRWVLVQMEVYVLGLWGYLETVDTLSLALMVTSNKTSESSHLLSNFFFWIHQYFFR